MNRLSKIITILSDNRGGPGQIEVDRYRYPLPVNIQDRFNFYVRLTSRDWLLTVNSLG